LKLKTEQIKKYSNYLKIIGISTMVIYVSFGLYAYIISDNSCSYSVFCSALTDAFADQSTEGNNYFVTITDSIEASEILR